MIHTALRFFVSVSDGFLLQWALIYIYKDINNDAHLHGKKSTYPYLLPTTATFLCLQGKVAWLWRRWTDLIVYRFLGSLAELISSFALLNRLEQFETYDRFACALN